MDKINQLKARILELEEENKDLLYQIIILEDLLKEADILNSYKNDEF